MLRSRRPGPPGRQGTDQSQRRFADGVHDGDLPGQQCDLPVLQGAGGAIAHIPDDRMTGVGELQPDLMTPAGLQRHLQQTPVPGAADQTILQPRFAAARGGFGKDAAGRPLSCDVIAKGSVRLQGRAFDDRQIGFLDRLRTKLGAQARGGFGGACEEHHARHRSIQAVYQAEKHPAGFGISVFQPALGQIQQARCPGMISLCEQAGRLEEREQVVVLEENRPAGMIKTAIGAHGDPLIDNQQSCSTAHDTMKQTSQESSSGCIGSPGPEKMVALFDRCGIHLSALQVQQLWTYHGMLRQSNPELNLTRVHNFDNMVIKLYVDSILPADLMQLPSPLLDLGTGPGMPGIPLKIYQPHLEILLAESRRKRVDFLAAVVDRLQLEGVRIIEKKIGAGFEEPVAGVITRAVETMAKTLERVRGCLAPGGRVIFMKGPHCEAELDEVRNRWLSVYKPVEDRAYIIPHTRHRRRLVVMERIDQPRSIPNADAGVRFPVKMIASESNTIFKEMKKLLGGRGIKKWGRALFAGSKPIAEALKNHPAHCEAWISSDDRQPPPADAPDRLAWYQLAPRLFEMLDVFGTHAPLLLLRVPPFPSWRASDGFAEGCNLLVPFQDPENVGAVIRSAAAFGVGQVILLAESAHPFHPKSLRASGATVMSTRLVHGPSLKELPADLPIIALSAEGDDIRATVFPPSFGLLIGLEGPGLPAAWRRTARRIPIRAAVESLNAAAAAAIALYEWSRQASERRQPKRPSFST